MFYKKQRSWNIRKFHVKALVLESLFNKIAGLQAATLSKRDSNTGSFLWKLWNFLEHLRTSANDCFCLLESISEMFLMCCIWIYEYSPKYPSGNVCKVKPSLSLIYLVKLSHVELNLGEKWTPRTEVLTFLFKRCL